MKQTFAILMLCLAACGGHGASPTAPSTPSTPTTTDPDPLRNAAAAAGKLIGAAVQSSFLNDARYGAVFMRHFDYVTAEYEMKWDPIEKTRGVDDFSGGDLIAGFAAAHGMQVKGHALLWHQAVPSWVGGLPASDL